MSSRDRAGRLAAAYPARTPARAGFTLIELLLAIALLSAMLALLFGAFFQITGGAAKVGKQVDERQRLRLMIGFIADDLAAAQYLPEFAAAGRAKRPSGLIADTEYVQQGEFSRIDLHAQVPARFHRAVAEGEDPELHEIGYRVRPNAERTRLQLVRREDFHLDDDIRAGGIEAPLADRVKTFLVEYLAASDTATSESQEDWLDEWDSAGKEQGEELPAALRVTLAVLTDDGQELGESLVVNFPSDYSPPDSQGEDDEEGAPKESPKEDSDGKK